ncbi:MAG: hypothetical protein PHX38_04435 [Sulfuricella sp.]|nr:hypothetical protein [Sulfuricella sp.]
MIPELRQAKKKRGSNMTALQNPPIKEDGGDNTGTLKGIEQFKLLELSNIQICFASFL